MKTDCYITVKVQSNTANDYYENILKGLKIHLSKDEIRKICEATTFAKQHEDFEIHFDINSVKPFKSLNEKIIDPDIADVSDENFCIIGKDFFLEDNIFLYDSEEDNSTPDLSYYIFIDKEGIGFGVYATGEFEQIIYTSPAISLSTLGIDEDESQKIVYLAINEKLFTPDGKKKLVKCYSCEVMYLGEFDNIRRNNGEDISVVAQGFYDDDSLVQYLSNEIMLITEYFTSKDEAFKEGAKQALEEGFHIVNINEVKDIDGKGEK